MCLITGIRYCLCVFIIFKSSTMKIHSRNYISDGRSISVANNTNDMRISIKRKLDFDDSVVGIRGLHKNKMHNYQAHMRRVQRELVYDAQMIYNLSERALQLCPFSDFCFLNGSVIENNNWNSMSCCKDCYCDESCGERMDCCFDFLDDVKLIETNNLKCIRPLVEGTSMIFIYTKSYYMVDSCLGNASYECRSETSAIWGSLYPVYSPSTKMIYVNRHCAHCNIVNDTIPWEVYINCGNSDTISGSGLTDGLKYGQCQVQFRPQDKVSVDRFACNADVIASCNSTGSSSQRASALEEACALTRAEVTRYAGDKGIETYSNVFCKICNEIDHVPQELCIAPDEFIKIISNSLTALIDWQVVSLFLPQKTSDWHDVDDSGECDQNEIMHPLKVTKLWLRFFCCTGRAARHSILNNKRRNKRRVRSFDPIMCPLLMGTR